MLDEDQFRMAFRGEIVANLVNERDLEKLTPYKSSTFRDWRVRPPAGGGPPYYRVNGRILYDLDEVFAWLKQKRHRSTSEYDTRPGGLKRSR